MRLRKERVKGGHLLGVAQRRLEGCRVVNRLVSFLSHSVASSKTLYATQNFILRI